MKSGGADLKKLAETVGLVGKDMAAGGPSRSNIRYEAITPGETLRRASPTTAASLQSHTRGQGEDLAMVIRRTTQSDTKRPAFSKKRANGKVTRPEVTPLLMQHQAEAEIEARSRLSFWEWAARVGRRNPWIGYIRAGILTLICATLTFILIFIPEQYNDNNLVTISDTEPFEYDLYGEFDQAALASGATKNEDGSIKWEPGNLRVSLVGRFLPNYYRPFIRGLRVVLGRGGNVTEEWILGLAPPDPDNRLQVHNSIKAHFFDLEGIDFPDSPDAFLRLETNATYPVPIGLVVSFVSVKVTKSAIYGALVLFFTYLMISLEVAHRTVVSMLSATAAIATLATLNERPSLGTIVTWLDIETLVLLFSMMVIVSVMSETGIFDHVGTWAFHMTGGRAWPLMTTLVLITSLASAFLDNVTTILLLTPVVIQMCEKVEGSPKRMLMAMVIFSNIGGAMTSVGDPPNVLITSDPTVIESGVSFSSFLAHMLPGVTLVALACFALLRLWLYKDLADDFKRPMGKRDEILHQIAVWNRTAESLSSISKEEMMVKKVINSKVKDLRDVLLEDEATGRGRRCLDDHGGNPLLSGLGENSAAGSKIVNKPLLIQSSVILAIVIVLFFLQDFPKFNLSLGWTALLGAMAILVVHDKAELESILARVEWATLIFFATLFVLMKALNELGFIQLIGTHVSDLVYSVDSRYRLTVAILLVLWVSGIASAFIDNIPFTTVMLPVIKTLAEDDHLRLPLAPLAYALAMGTCLGGNGTLLGASANLVCAGVARQHGHDFTFVEFFKVGFPVSVLSLLVASVYLLICHVAIGWN